MRYTIVNPEDIPPNLPPGEYTTEIVSANWDEIKIRYIGEAYNRKAPTCLLPIIIEGEVVENG